MTIDEIRKKAPDGATHWKMSRCLKDTIMYFKYKNGKYAQWTFAGWNNPVFYKKNDLKPL